MEGFGGCVTVPLCKLYLKMDLVSGPVVVGVHDSLIIKGVSSLMGIDIAGIRLLPNPVVCPSPVAYDPVIDVARINPGLFPACAVTRSQEKLPNCLLEVLVRMNLVLNAYLVVMMLLRQIMKLLLLLR